MITKKNIFYVLVICIIGQMLSCKKDSEFLKSLPHDRLTSETFWKSENDALNALTTCYITSFNFTPWGEECASDNSYGGYDWYSSTKLIADGTVNEFSPVVSQKWSNSYTAIRRCNLLLENISKVPFTTPNLKERIVAEARFIRAWQYLDLGFNFGAVPLATKTLTVEESKVLKQVPQKDIYKFVSDELNAVAEILPVQHSSADAARVTKGACYALKARLYLYQNDFPNVLNAIKQLDDLQKYRLNTVGETPYDDLFSGVNQRNAEVIFSVNKTEKKGALATGHDSNMALMLKGLGGEDPYFTIWPTGGIVDAYPMLDGRLISEAGSTYNAKDPYKNRDPRLSQSIFFPTSIVPTLVNGTVTWKTVYDPEDPKSAIAETVYSYIYGPKTGLNWKKYLDLTPWGYFNTSQGKNDIILIRYADVLLMKAEALIETNGVGAKTEAINLIDQLRDRVKGGKVHSQNYNSKDDLLKLVRNERRVELANEGLRYYDLIRWKIAGKNPVTDGEGLNGDTFGAFMRLDGVGKNDKTVLVDGAPRRFIETRVFNNAKRYLLPIPQREIDLNPNIKQNQ